LPFALPPFAHTGLLSQAVYLLLAGKRKHLDIHSIIFEQFPFTVVLLSSLSLNTACIFTELVQLQYSLLLFSLLLSFFFLSFFIFHIFRVFIKLPY